MTPSILMKLNTNTDFVSISDKPKATKKVWIKEPLIIPKTEYTPAFLPCEILLPTMYMVSAPGIRFNKIPANKNISKFIIPYIENTTFQLFSHESVILIGKMLCCQSLIDPNYYVPAS
jgi:hypothetical protein